MSKITVSRRSFLAGTAAVRLHKGMPDPAVPPAETALGALVSHITNADVRHFQPMNVNYGLFPDLEGRVKKKERRGKLAERALASLSGWLERVSPESRGDEEPGGTEQTEHS